MQLGIFARTFDTMGAAADARRPWRRRATPRRSSTSPASGCPPCPTRSPPASPRRSPPPPPNRHPDRRRLRHLQHDPPRPGGARARPAPPRRPRRRLPRHGHAARHALHRNPRPRGPVALAPGQRLARSLARPPRRDGEAAVAIAERFDIELGIEPELANVVADAAAARRLLDEVASPRLRIVLDPANLFERAEPAERRRLVEEAADTLGEALAMAHAKDRAADGSFTAAGRGRDRLRPLHPPPRGRRLRRPARRPRPLRRRGAGRGALPRRLLAEAPRDPLRPRRRPPRLRGRRRGPPVLFQHGLGGDAAQVAEVFPDAPPARRITLECRGQGGSSFGPPGRLSIATFADDLDGPGRRARARRRRRRRHLHGGGHRRPAGGAPAGTGPRADPRPPRLGRRRRAGKHAALCAGRRAHGPPCPPRRRAAASSASATAARSPRRRPTTSRASAASSPAGARRLRPPPRRHRRGRAGGLRGRPPPHRRPDAGDRPRPRPRAPARQRRGAGRPDPRRPARVITPKAEDRAAYRREFRAAVADFLERWHDRPARRGFLPIQTNWFDRLFIAIYIGVALELLWMRFLEPTIPLWICHIIVLALGVVIIRKG